MQLIAKAAQLPQRTIQAIEDWLITPIDARVYAVVRITYGIMCLGIVLELWSLREALFTEQGMSFHRPDLLFYILFKWIRSTLGVSLLMVTAGIAAIMVMVGLFTRAALVVLYLWNFAYCAIGYPAEAGYDGIARIVGFILLWGPPMRSWSLDARIFGPRPAEEPRYSLRLMQWQLAIIYIATVWLKAPDNYWRSGELMAYFMMSMYSNFPFAAWAWLGRTSVLMTWGTLFFEAAIPFCLVLGGSNTFYRRAAFLMGVALHGGIAITSTIGMFSLSMVPLYAAFLTREDIDDAAKLVAWVRGKSATSSAPETTTPSTVPASVGKAASVAKPSIAKVAKS